MTISLTVWKASASLKSATTFSSRRGRDNMAGRKKVTIVGGGQTGGIMAYHLAQKNICDIVIKDVAEFAQHHGKSLDIMQGGPFGGFETKITPTDDWEATTDSDVIVITSGAPRKPGMTREDLLK